MHTSSDITNCVLPEVNPSTLRQAIEAERRRFLFMTGMFVSAAVVLSGLAMWHIDATPDRVWDGLSRLGFLFAFMWPPNPGGELGRLTYALVETLAIATIGTLAAALISFPISFLAARNIIPSWFLRWPLRRGMDVIRGIDVLIFALIFISAIGLGPFAGILAIAVNDVGNFTKLFSEAIENNDHKPVEGATASGCSRVEAIRFGLLPNVLPVMLSHVLFLFESNVRAASIIGLVGAGGIGFELSERIRGNFWDQAVFIILMLIVTVAVIDYLSNQIRKK